MIRPQKSDNVFLDNKHLVLSDPTAEISLQDIHPTLRLHFSVVAKGEERVSQVILTDENNSIQPTKRLSGDNGYFLLFADKDALIAVNVDEQSPTRVSFYTAYMNGKNSPANEETILNMLGRYPS